MIRNRYKQVLCLLILTIFLGSLPFLWTPQDVYNLGGDDSRLYLYSPSEWLKNVALWPWFSFSGFNQFAPQQAHLPFIILESIISWLFPRLNLQKLIYGITIALGFLSVYLFLKTLISNGKTHKNYSLFIAGIIGGFSYIFLPLLFYRWASPVNSIYGVFVYPFLFLFFLKAIQKRNIKYLIFGALLSMLGSISVSCFAFLLPFLIGAFLFLFSYVVLLKKFNIKLYFWYGLLYILLVFLINSFWMIPFLNSTTLGNEAVSMALDESVRELSSAQTRISPTIATMNITDTLLGLLSRQFITEHTYWFPADSYTTHNIRFSVLNLFILLAAFFGFLITTKRKKTKTHRVYLCIAVAFLVLAYFQTVNVGTLGVSLFASMIKAIPGFLMVRNFYGKFPIAYSFFYGCLVGASIYLILYYRRGLFLKVFLCLSVLVALFIQAIPFLDGRVNSLPYSIDTKLNSNVKFSENFLKSIEYVENLKQDFKVLTFPFTVGSWSAIKEKNSPTFYIGASPLKIWAGINDFNSKFAFNNSFIPDFSVIIKESFLHDQNLFLKRLFGLLNINYVFYCPGVYESDVSEGIKNKILWGYLENFDQKRIESFLKDFSFENEFGDYQIYKLPEEFILPQVYIPNRFVYLQGEGRDLVDTISFNDWEVRSKIYLSSIQEARFGIDDVNQADEVFIPGYCVKCNLFEKAEIELPFVRIYPDSIFYPLISFKENRWEKSVAQLNDPSAELNTSLILAGKRLAEIKRMVEIDKKEKEGIILETIKRYNARIEKLSSPFIETERKQEEINDSLLVIEDHLDKHSEILSALLREHDFSQTWKLKIWFENTSKNLESVLVEIRKKQWVSDEKTRRYYLDVPRKGEYELFLKNFEADQLENLLIELDGEEIKVDKVEVENSQVVTIGKILFSQGKHKLAISLPAMENLVAEDNLLIQTADNQRKGISLPISNFNEQDVYRISLIYRGGPAKFSIVQDTDKESEELGRVIHKIEEELEEDALPRLYEVVLKPDFGAKKAEILFVLEPNEWQKNFLEIEEIQVENVPQPRVLLRMAEERSPSREIPTINFRRVNPVRYEVIVEGATKPFDLIFSESFHNGWRVYISDRVVEDNEEPVATYFNGEIKERERKNIFLDKDFLKDWREKSIPEDRHYLVNGYANAWRLTPEDTGNVENYLLVIEFWPQRLVFFGMAISILTLLVCLGYLGWSYFKLRK